MKQPETSSGRRKALRGAWLTGIICLVFAGVMVLIALMSFAGVSYSVYLRHEVPPGLRLAPPPGAMNSTTGLEPRPETRPEFRNFLLLPLIITLLSAAISFFAGITLLGLVRDEEARAVHRQAVSSMILPDEKTVLQILEASGGELTQSELVARSKLSRVKVHRVVKRLESLGIVGKFDYGMTNKIRLEKDYLEK